MSNEAVASEAYVRVQADLARLKPDEFKQVNLDITPAVTTILGVLPEIKALRERIVKELPFVELDRGTDTGKVLVLDESGETIF